MSARVYAITFDCDCGVTIKNRTLDVTGSEELEIDIQMLGQQSFDCPQCGRVYGIGDIDVEELEGPDKSWDGN